jgi:hypothetical protein
MGSEEQLLAASIRDTIAKARQAQRKLFHLCEASTLQNIDHGAHADALHEAQETLAFYIEKAFRDISILAERLGLPLFRADVVEKRKSFTDLSALVPTPYDVMLQSEPLDAARDLFDSLATMTEGRAVTGIGIFETLLENTPKIMDASGILPKTEAEIRKQVLKALSFCFRDVVREIPFPKNIKSYRPDIGVRSLMAAAEYKLVDSQQKAKNSLDEIYADMKGYGGRYDWRSFYAVFYMTAPFYTQKDFDEEFRLVRAELSWTPIVVVGHGARVAKAARRSRSAGKA